jgi:hypothetical protein
VDGVALSTRHIIKRVRRSANVGTRERLGMTSETGVERLFGRELRKSNDRRFATVSFDMVTAGAMAAFTACVFRFFCATGDTLEVGVLIKPGPDIGMAGLAYGAAEIAVLGLTAL